MLQSAANSLNDIIDEIVEQNLPKWSHWRQHLHAHPERSWDERQTTAFLVDRIEALGLRLQPGPRGLGGRVDLDMGEPDPGLRIALRGDIDAIPVDEATSLPWRSVVPGVMHACGHDVHATIVLAVCEAVCQLNAREALPHPVRISALFQPAEEVGQGAREMIASGLLAGVDSILAVHVDPTREVGAMGIRDGVQTACCDELRLVVEGSGGHGARPHETGDTILAAAHFIQSAHALIPRIVDARNDTVLSFCKVVGGDSSNVIPTRVEVLGTLRSFDGESRQRILDRLQALSQAVATSFELEVTFSVVTRIPSVDNCPRLNRLVTHVAREMLGADAVTDAVPSLGGEDFACYQEHIPGSLIRVGSARGEQYRYHLHSPHFDVDEHTIAVACRLLTRSLVAWFPLTHGPAGASP